MRAAEVMAGRLAGKRVLVTRAREQAGGIADRVRGEGGEAVVVPTIEIRPPSDPEPLARAARDLCSGAYDWLALTSANAADRTWEAVVAAGGGERSLSGVKIAVVGPGTAKAIARHGLRADVVAEESRGEGLAEAMLVAIGGRAARVLLARAAKARDVLPEALARAGCAVDVVTAYETHPASRETADALVGELQAGRIDAVTFTSGSTVDSLCDLLGGGARAVELLSRTRIASIGPVTTAAARARGLRVDVTASEATVEALVRALAESYQPAV